MTTTFTCATVCIALVYLEMHFGFSESFYCMSLQICSLDKAVTKYQYNIIVHYETESGRVILLLF